MSPKGRAKASRRCFCCMCHLLHSGCMCHSSAELFLLVSDAGFFFSRLAQTATGALSRDGVTTALLVSLPTRQITEKKTIPFNLQLGHRQLLRSLWLMVPGQPFLTLMFSQPPATQRNPAMSLRSPMLATIAESGHKTRSPADRAIVIDGASNGQIHRPRFLT